MVINEAMHIASGGITFEKPPSVDNVLPEPTVDDDAPVPEIADEIASRSIRSSKSVSVGLTMAAKASTPNWWTDEYKLAKQYLFGDESENIVQDFDTARILLLSESKKDTPSLCVTLVECAPMV